MKKKKFVNFNLSEIKNFCKSMSDEERVWCFRSCPFHTLCEGWSEYPRDWDIESIDEWL